MKIQPLKTTNTNYYKSNVIQYRKPISPAMKANCCNHISCDDLRFIKNVLDKCHYGKKSMLKNPLTKLEIDDNFFVLKNFYTNFDTPDYIEGICEELTQKAGNILNKNIGDRYNIIGVAGSTKPYFMNHNLLFCTPKSNENNFNLENLLHISKEILKIKEQQFLNLYGNKSSVKQSLYLNFSLLKLKMELNKNINGIFIDPSFKKVLPVKSPEAKSLYSDVELFYNLNSYNPEDIKDLYFETSDMSVPIGYIIDLAPELLKYKFNPNDMIGIKFSINNKKPVISYSIFDIMGEHKDASVINNLPQDHILKSFVTRINKRD